MARKTSHKHIFCQAAAAAGGGAPVTLLAREVTPQPRAVGSDANNGHLPPTDDSSDETASGGRLANC